MTTKYDSKIIL